MDLVYIPDLLAFGSFRSPQYRDYEQPWNRNYFEDDKSAAYSQQRHQQPQQQHRDSHASKDSCHLCKESKRRSLAAYIRGKTRNNSCGEICEEAEEEGEAAAEQARKPDADKSGKLPGVV